MKEHPDWVQVLEAGAGDVRRLAFVTRYSSIPVSFHENVAEHQYWVALYAALIHGEVMPQDQKLIGPILLKAILHDLAESVTGDVVRTFKYSSMELKEAIDNAEDKIVDAFPKEVVRLYNVYHEMLLDEDEKSAALESKPDFLYVEAVVKAADFMSLQQYMNREWLRGNREITPFFDRMIADLTKMAEKIAKAQEPRVRQLAGLYSAMADRAMFSKQYTT